MRWARAARSKSSAPVTDRDSIGNGSDMSIDYEQKIPNNVALASDKTLQRALEHWQPEFLKWWGERGPEGSPKFDVYLGTATSVDQAGWAQFGYVKMPDYRWGIFLNPAIPERKIGF